MAKISARGAGKVCTVQTDPVQEDDMLCWCIFTLCSDGRVLRKSCYSHNGVTHSGAHRLWGRIRNPAEMTKEFLVNAVRRRGYRVK